MPLNPNEVPGSPTRTVRRGVEDRLKATVDQLQFPDLARAPGRAPQGVAHLGCVVSRQGSQNTGQYRDSGLARAVDQIQVTFTFRVNPQDQLRSVDEADDVEDQIRRSLTTPSWFGALGWSVTWISTESAEHPASPEALRYRLNFEVQRDATLSL